MSDYTPTYEVIQAALEYYSAGCGGYDSNELDRFIAAERAEAWDEAIDFISRHYEDYLPHRWDRNSDDSNPYRTLKDN